MVRSYLPKVISRSFFFRLSTLVSSETFEFCNSVSSIYSSTRISDDSTGRSLANDHGGVSVTGRPTRLVSPQNQPQALQ